MKAVGTGWARGVRWADIETQIEPGDGAGAASRVSDRLCLRLHGTVRAIAEDLAGARRAARPHLAVSRSRTHAMAGVRLEARSDADGRDEGSLSASAGRGGSSPSGESNQ